MKTIRKLKYPITIIVIIIIIIGAVFIQKKLNNQKYELSNEPKEDNKDTKDDNTLDNTILPS